MSTFKSLASAYRWPIIVAALIFSVSAGLSLRGEIRQDMLSRVFPVSPSSSFFAPDDVSILMPGDHHLSVPSDYIALHAQSGGGFYRALAVDASFPGSRAWPSVVAENRPACNAINTTRSVCPFSLISVSMDSAHLHRPFVLMRLWFDAVRRSQSSRISGGLEIYDEFVGDGGKTFPFKADYYAVPTGHFEVPIVFRCTRQRTCRGYSALDASLSYFFIIKEELLPQWQPINSEVRDLLKSFLASRNHEIR